MPAAKLLIAGTIVHAHAELKQMLGEHAEILQLESTTSRAQFLKDLAPGGRYSSITHVYRHNDSAAWVGFFDAEVVDAFPSTLVAICHNGAGYDQIDVAACKSRGIWVSHTPMAVDDATADTAMFLTLSALRGYWKAEKNAREGKWKSGLKPAHDPEGKTLGIVGMGGIGSAYAKRAAAFDMKIIYHNRNPSPTADPSFGYRSDLASLLAESDVVSLNLPLNEHTKGSFGKAQFDQMKDGAVLINTARGGVVDQEALIDALRGGKLASAGLDVYPDEPNIDERLLAMDNITLLPHMGTETVESQKKMEVQVLTSILSSIQGGEPNDGKGRPKFVCKEFL